MDPGPGPPGRLDLASRLDQGEISVAGILLLIPDC